MITRAPGTVRWGLAEVKSVTGRSDLVQGRRSVAVRREPYQKRLGDTWMPTANTMRTTQAVTVRGGDLSRLLERAACGEAAVRATLDDNGVSFGGRLCAVAADTATCRVDERDQGALGDAAGAGCSVSFELGGERFSFSTTVVSVEGTLIVLRRPTALGARQRRRFWRADVRESGVVELARPDGLLRGAGDLLNVSPAGMACLLDDAVAGCFSVGERVVLGFGFGDDEWWRVEAELRAKTVASDPRRVVGRLRFIAESMPQELRDRLSGVTKIASDSR